MIKSTTHWVRRVAQISSAVTLAWAAAASADAAGPANRQCQRGDRGRLIRYEKVGDRLMTACCPGWAGKAVASAGKPSPTATKANAVAMKAFSEHLELAKQSGDPARLAATHSSIGVLLGDDQERYAEALPSRERQCGRGDRRRESCKKGYPRTQESTPVRVCMRRDGTADSATNPG